MTERHTLLDHVLEQMNQIGPLKLRCSSIRLVPEFEPAPMIMLAQQLSPARAELGDADEFCSRIFVRNLALNSHNASVFGERLFSIVRWMLGARLVVSAPVRVHTERDIGI